MIRLANINRLNEDLKNLLAVAQEIVLASNQVMLGKYTKQFEEEIAEFSNAKYCSVVGSGSDALMYGLMATDIQDIIIPSQTFIATKNSCERANINVNFCDVDTKGCIDWNLIENKQIVTWVGLFGNDTKVPKGIKFVEDGAQHFGLPLKGTFASYSFDPTKSLPNLGNGGCIVTNNYDIHMNVQDLRRHGKLGKYTGGNSLISERDCAELSVKLKFFDAWKKRRQELANIYKQELKDYVRIITDVKGIVSKFVIATDKKEQLKCYLLSKDIQCKDVYKHALDIKKQAMKNCREFLSIPCDSYTTDEEASTVIDSIKTFFEPGPFKT